MNKNRLPSRAPHPSSAGFTLLEMLIALAIVVILTSVTMESITKTRSQTSLNQTAQELALLLREVQQKGISVTAVPVNGVIFYPAYGFLADLSTPTQVRTFPDLPTDRRFNPTSLAAYSTEVGDGQMNTGSPWGENSNPAYILNSRVRLSKIRYDTGSGAADVQNGIFHVVYHRPDPTVYFKHGNGNNTLDTSHVWICLETIDGSNLRRKIDIWKTGQIALDTSGAAYNDCS